MNPLKIAAAVVNQTPLDWKRNVQHHLDAIAEAKKQNISLLCFPELSISGYGCEDMFYAPGVTQTAGEMLQIIAEASEGIMVSVGLPVRYNHRLYNTACFIADKKIQGFVCKKIFLAIVSITNHVGFMPGKRELLLQSKSMDRNTPPEI